MAITPEQARANGRKGGRPKGSKSTTPALAEFAKSIIDKAEYRQRLERQAIAGELHPKLEEKLWTYAYPEPKADKGPSGITVNLGVMLHSQPVAQLPQPVTIETHSLTQPEQPDQDRICDSPRLRVGSVREDAG